MTNTNVETFIPDSSVEWEQVNDLVKRKIMAYDTNLMIVKVDFSKGGIGPIHDHYHSQTTYIESGEFAVTIGDETKTLKAGDVYYIPPHMPHGATAIEAGILLDFFSPMREDFIK